MARQRVAIDGSNRRRLYLFRHGTVDCIGENGELIGDPDLVKLNARGRAQAQAMARLFVDVHVDKAICTGLPRTLETATAILGRATGVGLQAVGLLDQSTCRLDVLDFDFDTDGTLLRKTIRGMNITADDPVMRTRDAGDMELLARRLLHGKV